MHGEFTSVVWWEKSLLGWILVDKVHVVIFTPIGHITCKIQFLAGSNV